MATTTRPSPREKAPNKTVNIGRHERSCEETFATFKLRYALAEGQQYDLQSTGVLGGSSMFQRNLADSLGDLLFNWKNSEVAFYLSIPGSDIPIKKIPFVDAIMGAHPIIFTCHNGNMKNVRTTFHSS